MPEVYSGAAPGCLLREGKCLATAAPALKKSLSGGGRHYFSHCSSGPPVHFTHQTLTIHHLGISSDGINAIVTHFIIAKKKSARGLELTP